MKILDRRWRVQAKPLPSPSSLWWFRAWITDTHMVIVVTEPHDNCGISVTNAVEDAMREAFELACDAMPKGMPKEPAGRRVVYYEHYEGRRDDIDLVTFYEVLDTGEYRKPSWTPSSVEHVESLIGEPFDVGTSNGKPSRRPGRGG